MLQASQLDTFVLATGRTKIVRDFVSMAFRAAGFELAFRGTGEQRTAVDSAAGKTRVRVNPCFYRLAEVELLVGDAAEVHRELGWQPAMTLEQLCDMMVKADLWRYEAGFSFKAAASAGF